jgi:colicin import membrane protein
MGKKSLIKSTAKKKAGETATKKAAAKTTKKTTAKSAKKTTGKSASKAKAGKTTKKPATKAQKAAKKKLSVKELTFLKFEPVGPVAAKLAAPQPAAAAPTAPPLITTQDAGEADRLRTLLAKKFNMAEITAAAKAPEEKPAAPAAPEVTPAAEVAPPEPEHEEPPATEPVETTPPEPKAQEVPEEAPDAEPAAPAPQPRTAAPKQDLKPAQVVRKKITIPQPAPAPEPEPAGIQAPTASAEQPTHADPVTRTAKIAVAAAALIIILLLAVSANNSGKFYIKPIDNAIEIWKGNFSPKDKSFYMVLHGVQAPEPLKSVYSKEEIYPLIFKYYIDKSDTLLDVEGLPDFEGIKKYLHEAQDFAITSEMKTAVKDRLNTIDRMVLLYKADVAISRNTEDSLESAIEILDDAGKLTSSTVQEEEIAQKLNTAKAKLEALKAPKTVENDAQPAETDDTATAAPAKE